MLHLVPTWHLLRLFLSSFRFCGMGMGREPEAALLSTVSEDSAVCLEGGWGGMGGSVCVCMCVCVCVCVCVCLTNPRRACARVTVVVLCVQCVSVCLSVTALAATVSVYTCNQRHPWVSLRLYLILNVWNFEKP